MPKVTVIMPSLNVAQYIIPCMESVLSQTLHDIEILGIDAGSEDGTLEILNGYARTDKRIKVIHSDKRSYGYQLNMGISLARGEYIGIVETDDVISRDMFRILYEEAIKTKANYVKGTAQSFMRIADKVTVQNRILCVPAWLEMGTTVSSKIHPELFVTDRFVWLGIYRSDFIKAIRLNESPGAAFQDIGFMFQVISSAGKAVYLDQDVYYYRQDNKNASSYDRNGFRYLVTEYLYVKKFLEGKDQGWGRVYYEKLLDQCLGRFRMMAVLGEYWQESQKDLGTLQVWFQEAIKTGAINEQTVGSEKWETLQMFLKDSRAVYQKYVAGFEKSREHISDILHVIGVREVVIFGCGSQGKFLHALLENSRPDTVSAYCDNNGKFHGTSVQGLPVLTPKESVQEFPDACYVISSTGHVREMRMQLEGYGVSPDRITEYTDGTDMMLLRLKISPAVQK